MLAPAELLCSDRLPLKPFTLMSPELESSPISGAVSRPARIRPEEALIAFVVMAPELKSMSIFFTSKRHTIMLSDDPMALSFA